MSVQLQNISISTLPVGSILFAEENIESGKNIIVPLCRRIRNKFGNSFQTKRLCVFVFRAICSGSATRNIKSITGQSLWIRTSSGGKRETGEQMTWTVFIKDTNCPGKTRANRQKKQARQCRCLQNLACSGKPNREVSFEHECSLWRYTAPREGGNEMVA